MKDKDLTPEQQTNCDRIIEEWIARNVEYAVADDGSMMFRLKEQPAEENSIHPSD